MCNFTLVTLNSLAHFYCQTVSNLLISYVEEHLQNAFYERSNQV